MSGVEENTLGVVVGRENLPRRGRGFRRPARTVSTTRANQHALGGHHLTVGTVTASAGVTLFLLVVFLGEQLRTGISVPAMAAWAVLLGLALISAVMVRGFGVRLPSWLFTLLLIGGASVIVLDVLGTWGHSEAGLSLTAAYAVPVLLLAAVTLRETVQIIIADVVIGLALVVCTILEPRTDALTLAPEFMLIGLAVGAPLLGVAVVRAYRRMVQLDLDLALVQSTVQAPRLAVGMLASEELTRLDDDAERLLVDVAAGRLPLPLPMEQSSRASALATELRLHLIEGRKETWLRHAVAESEFLAPAVTIDDGHSLAGLLAAGQRDALLLALWLLVSNTERAGSSVHMVFGPAHAPRVGRYRTVRFPIVMETSGVPRRRVDAAVWDALGIVGPHVDSVREHSVRVEIDCSVENPSDT